MHRASQFSNTGQCAITIIVTNRGGQSNRKKRSLAIIQLDSHKFGTDYEPLNIIYFIDLERPFQDPFKCLILKAALSRLVPIGSKHFPAKISFNENTFPAEIDIF